MEELNQGKIALLRQMIESADRNIAAAKQILVQLDGGARKPQITSEASQIIEGTFDGEKMIGMDDKKYPIPVNYASKSKLVEGDLLKLTITDDGSFLFKQISPIERRTIIGTVIRDGDGKHYVYSEGRKYKVLLASLTYFKAKEGDEVTLIVPREKISEWGAIEAVIGTSEGNTENLNNLNYANSDREEKEDNDSMENISEENEKNETIEDEWTPDIEEIKKEARVDEEDKNESRGILDDLIRGN
ncbi:MAG: hypothetical protein U9N04_01605 [Patescibacteria group bacterium]|nr:hypothetical protein [Patescibacteria group bacterium]